MLMAKGYAVVVGAVLLLVGILGFVKGSNAFMGLHFNTTHNAIHCLTGLIGLIAGLAGGTKGARVFAQVFGVIYTLVAILGFAGVAYLNDLLMLNTLYNVIHLAVGLLGLLAGFTGAKEATA
jgi:hypothetical protein